MLFDRRLPNIGTIDVDKASEGLVWLLSRMPQPDAAPVAGSGFVLRRNLAPLLLGAGGTKEPKLDGPCGFTSILSPQQVKELSDWLEGIDADQLRLRYDPKAMTTESVFPDIWLDDEGAFEDYLMPYFNDLRSFFVEARAKNQYVLVFFT